jgi:hypothetical protein
MGITDTVGGTDAPAHALDVGTVVVWKLPE